MAGSGIFAVAFGPVRRTWSVANNLDRYGNHNFNPLLVHHPVCKFYLAWNTFTVGGLEGEFSMEVIGGIEKNYIMLGGVLKYALFLYGRIWA